MDRSDPLVWLRGLVDRFGIGRHIDGSIDQMTADEIEAPSGLIAPLFDPDYYLEQNPDVADAGVNCYVHYLQHGWREGRRFSSLFDVEYYRQIRPEPMPTDMDPLSDYANTWRGMDQSPSPLFMNSIYLRQNAEADVETEPLYQYCRLRRGGYRGFPYSEGDYLRRNFDVVASQVSPLIHLSKWGLKENRLEYLPIDLEFYNSWNGVELETRTQAALHYAREGRQKLAITKVADAPGVSSDRPNVDPPTGRVVVGLVVGDEPEPVVRRALRSLRGQQAPDGLDLTVRVSIAEASPAGLDDLGDVDVVRQYGRSPAQRHNSLMRSAFLSGADYYIAANASGVFFPDTVRQLAQSAERHRDRALVDAARFPIERAKHYDNITGQTAWASSSCFLLPRSLWAEIGGFDEALGGLGADVDLSWRARAAGYLIIYCPTARFHDQPADDGPGAPLAFETLSSVWRLGMKYGAAAFINDVETQMLDQFGCLPDRAQAPAQNAPLPSGVADFDHGLAFSTTRF